MLTYQKSKKTMMNFEQTPMSVSACPLFAHRGDNAVTVGGGFHLHPLRPDGSG
ncbi:hypothetical protein ACE8EZ_15780 [Pantoea deleyi]|uniref:hypothetical protein n=1 Tax=Pantoea deleyi TaxID=470932 RepID=UPI0035D40FAB